jgi:hypothetical protein
MKIKGVRYFSAREKKMLLLQTFVIFSRTVRKRSRKRECRKSFIQDSISFLFLRKINEKFVLNIVFVN